MSHYQLLKKIKTIRSLAHRIKPDADWVLATRSTLLMQVKNTLPVSALEKKSMVKEWFKFFTPFFSFGKWLRTPVFSVIGILLALFGGSLLSVSAAERSIPGDLLYSVKLATEQARLALAKNPQERVMLKTEFTGRRVDEMKQVVTASVSDRKDRVIQTAEALKQDMHTLKQQLGEMQNQSSPEAVKETAKIVDQKTNAVVQALQESKGDMTPEEKAKVTEAQVAASDTSVKAIEVMVDTHKTAGDVVTDQDVTDILKTHNETMIKTMAQSAGLNPNSATSTAALSVPATTTSMTSSTVATLEKVSEAQKSFTEADKLVAEKKIDEAVVKIKEGTQQAFAAQKTAEQAIVIQVGTPATGAVSGSVGSGAATGTSSTSVTTSTGAKAATQATNNAANSTNAINSSTTKTKMP